MPRQPALIEPPDAKAFRCQRPNYGYQRILSIVPQKPERSLPYGSLRSDLSQERTREVLSVLNRPEILDALTQNKIVSIILERLPGKSQSAYYDFAQRSVTVNTARKFGTHFGEEWKPGKTGNMSAATKDKVESMRRALLQEVAHHFENGNIEVARLRDAAFRDPRKRPITRYAAANPGEYLAESFVAYMVDPEALAAYDQLGSMMVEKVLSAARRSTL